MTVQNHHLINNYFWFKAAQPTPCRRGWLWHTIKKWTLWGNPLSEMQHRCAAQISVSEGTHMLRIKQLSDNICRAVF